MPLRYNEFMKFSSKFVRYFPHAAAFLLVFVLVLSTSGIAFAEDFDILHPTDDYFPVENAQYVAAGANFIAVYDSANDNVVVSGVSVGAHDFYLSTSSYDAISGLWIAGNTLLVEYGTDAKSYLKLDMAAETPAFVSVPTLADVTYITSDGRYFYCHAADNSLSVYNSALEAVKSNYFHAVLSEERLFAADNMTLYIFAVIYGVRCYYVLDINQTSADPSVGENTLFVPYRVTNGDGALFINTEEGIYAVDKTTGNGMDIEPIACAKETAFASYGNKLYVPDADGGISVYEYDFEAKTRTLTETLAMRGNGMGRLDAPTDVLFDEGGMFVADSANNRVVFVTDEGETDVDFGEAAPLRLAAGNNGVYATSKDTVFVIEGGTARPIVGITENIRDIVTVNGSTLVLTDRALYRLFAGTLNKLAAIENGIAAACAEDSDAVYVMTQEGLYTLSADGTEKLPFRAYPEFAGASDFAVDYAGNVYVVYPAQNKISVLDNLPSALVHERDVELTSDILTPAPVSVTLNGSKACFASRSCFVGSVEVGAVDKNTFTPVPAPALDEHSAYTFASVASDGYMIEQPERLDTLSPLAANTVVMVFTGASGVDGYEYVYCNGKRGYVETSLLNAVTPASVNKEYVLAASAPVYAYPSAELASAASEPTRLIVIDDAAGLDGGKWMRVTFDGGIYFAAKSDLTEYVEIIPEKERVFGRAVADRAGGVVNAYILPDISSAVAFETVDGTRLEILEESGDFYLVKVDDKTGYVLKSDVELEGLTTVQIISIVLACAVVVTGTVVFIVTYYTRKKEKE